MGLNDQGRLLGDEGRLRWRLVVQGRPANALYCPQCGSSFPGGAGPRSDPRDDPASLDFSPDAAEFDLIPRRMSVDFSVWAGLKLGVGFTIGASLVGLFLSVVALVLLSMGVGGLHR